MRKYVTAKERNAMRRMRESGATLRTICEHFPQWHHKTVQLHVRGVPVSKTLPRRSRKCDPLAALRLREQDVTFREIGERFGVTPAAVFMSCQRYLEKQEARA